MPKEAKKKKVQCENCKWWAGEEVNQTDKGVCHRFPTPYDQPVITKNDYYCGEHE